MRVKFLRPARRARFAAFTLVEILTVLVVPAFLAAALLPVLVRARERAQQATCLAHVRQITQAYLLYLQDWDEQLPDWYLPGPPWPAPFGARLFWTELLQPYLRSEKLYRDPSALWTPQDDLRLADYALVTSGRAARSRTAGGSMRHLTGRSALALLLAFLLGVGLGRLLPHGTAPLPAEKNLAGADLSGRDLRGAKLSGANLRAARLRGADLRGALLTRANLRGADLAGARLDGANLEQSALSHANLAGASLRQALLTDADLSGAVLSDARLDGCFMSRAVLRRAVAKRARLTGASLRGAWLDSADLTGARLDLVSLAGASADRVCLRNAMLAHVNLAGASLRRADLRGADLSQARLLRADLHGARHDDSTRWPSGFDPATSPDVQP